MTNIVIGKNVGFNMNMLLRRFDGLADGGQRLRTVDQQRDTIAGDQRCIGLRTKCIDQFAYVHVVVLRTQAPVDQLFAVRLGQRAGRGNDGRRGGRRVRGSCLWRGAGTHTTPRMTTVTALLRTCLRIDSGHEVPAIIVSS